MPRWWTATSLHSTTTKEYLGTRRELPRILLTIQANTTSMKVNNAFVCSQSFFKILILGLSTLTNISRYDLPDPDSYRDFFNVHPLYDFQSLQSTCTFFKGCPLNKLDLAIAYELPEILTDYKRKCYQASFDADMKANVPNTKQSKKK